MDVTSGQDAKSLIERMLSDRGNWEYLWESIAAVIAPTYARKFQGERSEGEKVYDRLFDSTAQDAAEKLARGIHTLLASPATPWFSIRFEDEELRDDDESAEWLEECNELMRDELNQSNWDQVFSELSQSLTAFATGVPAIFPGKSRDPKADPNEWHGLHIECWPLYECVGLESDNGVIETIGRKMSMTKLQMEQRYGDNCPTVVKKEPDPSKPFTVYYLTFPRSVAMPQGLVAPEQRPYAAMQVFGEDGMILENDGYYEQAVFMPRWMVRAGDTYGTGPGERAQPEAATLNEARRLEMLAWEKAIDPPLWAWKSKVDGKINNYARGVTHVKDPNAIGEMPGQTDFQPHLIEMDQSRQMIRDIFLYHQLDLPPRQDIGAMTAYEVQKRLEKAYQLLGPVIARLQREVLSGAVQRVFGLMHRGGQFPRPPELIAQQQSRVTIEYDSPLARAQRMDDVDAIDRWVQDTVGIAGALPPEKAMEMLDLVDLDEAQRVRARRLGVPEKIIRNRDEVTEAREMRQRQMQVMQALEAAKGAGEAGQALNAAAPEGEGG